MGLPGPAQEHNQLLHTDHIDPQGLTAASKAAFEYGEAGIQGPVWEGKPIAKWGAMLWRGPWDKDLKEACG